MSHQALSLNILVLDTTYLSFSANKVNNVSPSGTFMGLWLTPVHVHHLTMEFSVRKNGKEMTILVSLV